MRRFVLSLLGLGIVISTITARTAQADPFRGHPVVRPDPYGRYPGDHRPLPVRDPYRRWQGTERRDDWMDASRLRGLLGRFDRATARYDFTSLSSIEAELRTLVWQELDEQRRETWRDARLGDRRGAYLDRYTREQVERVRVELDQVAGRQDPAALAYRRDRILCLIRIADDELRRA
jgi:hypothetical protein